MGCIPPIPDFTTGAPTCPDGYFYDPVQKLCCPLSTAPVNLQDPTIRKLVTALPDVVFDPAAAYKAGMQGVKESGIIERFVVAFLRGGIKLLAPLIEEAASLFDDFLIVLADAFQAAQGQHASGYYGLAATLVTDLLGIEVSGDALMRAFQSGGRQSAMVELGGSIFDVMAAEFTNIAQSGTTGAFAIAKGTGVGGLPAVPLSPVQGVAGAKAFLGYASAFAIREGNTDMLAALLPHGVGTLFKDFAEDFAKNLGIGRMARLVWKPLVNSLVAVPMQQAINLQYRPTLFDVGQAYRAWAAGTFTSEELIGELRTHGWSEARQTSLQWQHLKGPDRAALRALHATGLMSDQDYAVWEGREGRTAEVTAWLDKAEDMLPVRMAVLRAADSFLSLYLHGKMTATQYGVNINSIRKTALGQNILTDGEVQNLLNVQSIAIAGSRKHLSVAALTREYEDGVISLGEFEKHVTDIGYGPDDVQILVQELLISAKRASERNAKAAAGAQHGALARLSVAKMETAYVDGLITLDQVRTELAARQYAPSAIDAVAHEFLIKAGLQTPTPPKA